MNPKQLTILAVIAIALLGIYLLLQLGGTPTAEFKDLVAVDTSKVTSISLYYDGHTTTMERRSNGWQVVNPFDFKANDGLVVTLLGKLDDLRIETEVTDNKNSWGEYELTDAQASRVTIVQNGQEYTFFVGKSATGYRQSYARLAGEDTVFLIRGVYGTALKRLPKDWRQKKVADYEATEIIKVATPNMTLELQPDGATWRVTDKRGNGYDADLAKVNKLNNQLANLRTSDFPDEEEYADVNWNNPDHEVTVTLQGGTQKNIRFYLIDADKKRYFMRFADKPTVFRLYESMFRQTMNTADEMRPDEDGQ